jgi:hypothetical protein
MLLAGCGAKSDDATPATGDAPDEQKDETNTVGPQDPSAAGLPELKSGKAVVGYALSALSSASPKPGAALALADAQSAEFPQCSENGSPWDEATGQRMAASHPHFGARSFECQLKAHKSPESVRGAFEQNYKILCQVEKALGAAVEYTPAGTSSVIKIQLSKDCGWDQGVIDEIAKQSPNGFDGTVVAKSYATGPWQKSLELTSSVANFTLFITATATQVAF